MKADLTPKHYFNFDEETVILWFSKSNRYVIVSESLHQLIDLFLKVENKLSFTKTLKPVLNLDDDNIETIFNEISEFLESSNTLSKIGADSPNSIKIPKLNIKRIYSFGKEVVRINFQYALIESLIHPQISHHLIDLETEASTQFDIFKFNNDLYLYKNKTFVNSFKTNTFHFLQGKFALELTNSIYKLDIEQWVATFHASTVTNGKESIMIIGDSGNGKSTLSALLMANGFDLLADDFTPLYEDMQLYRYPAAVSIKKGAFKVLEPQIENFKALKTYTNGPKKVNLKYVPPNSSLGNSKTHFPCHKIVYVKFNPSSTSGLKDTSIKHILETLIPDSWISPKENHALEFLNWLKTVKCYELNYSNNDFAISKFKTLFDS